jgi:hypothetical protein
MQTSINWCTVKWARQDSNLRPTGYEPAALPLSYEPVRSAMKKASLSDNRRNTPMICSLYLPPLA